MSEPLIVGATDGDKRVAVDGTTLCVHQWRGSGPAILHVHHEDDEAWHVLKGVLSFRLGDRTQTAPAGTTVFVPAGVPHTYETSPDADYLIFLTPRLRALVKELQQRPANEHREIYGKHASELLE